MRVVSLLPSATEILCSIGGGRLLVGRSHECDFPGDLNRVPVLTRQVAEAGRDPAVIDARVREQLAAGSALYSLDTRTLADLKPDLILTQNLCHVCSVDLETVERLAAQMDPPPRVLSLNPDSFEAVLDDILSVGAATGLEQQAAAVVVGLRERMFRAADRVNPFADGPTVAFIEWTDPIFIGGHWTPQLIERAGARHPLNPTVAAAGSGAAAGPQQASRKAGKSLQVPEDVLCDSRPEAIIICPCGVGLNDGRGMAAELARRDWWPALPAVRAGRVALVDGNQMFSRPGPRLVDAFEWLVGWLNGRPEMIPEGFPWEQV